MRALLLAAAMATAAYGQFQLLAVNAGVETPVSQVFDFGKIVAGDTATAQFRVRNVSSSPASLYVLTLSGAGFSVPNAPVLPQTLDAQASVDFAIRFQADPGGAYSAGLTLPGISTILTATVVPGLLFRAASPIDFGSVEVGSSASVRVGVENHSNVSLPLPVVFLNGAGFSVTGMWAAGGVLDPQTSTGFDLHFAPPSAGAFSGSFTAGGQTFALAGTGVVPPPPVPQISVSLPQVCSGQQGTLQVSVDSPRLTTGVTVTLDFQGPPDPAVTFSTGARSFAFKLYAGQAQTVTSQFQTGTTAGTLVFGVTIDGVTTSQSVPIAPAAVTVSAASASRTRNGLTVQITGFDNTRTAGALSFDFYDRSGNLIPPSPIQATADFAGFFQSSGLAGLFELQANFPVNGDPSQIAAFEAKLTNAAGVVSTGRTAF